MVDPPSLVSCLSSRHASTVTQAEVFLGSFSKAESSRKSARESTTYFDPSSISHCRTGSIMLSAIRYAVVERTQKY